LAKCLAKTRKIGSSIVITLPKELVETQKIKENEYVEISVRKCPKNGFGALRGMRPFTEADELKASE